MGPNKQQARRKRLSHDPSETPLTSKDTLKSMKKTPKSAPPAKRKKLSEEIDDQISDDEFENIYQQVKSKEKMKKSTNKITPKKNIQNLLAAIDSDADDDDDDDDDDQDEDDFEETDSDDDDSDDDLANGNVDEDEDDDDDDDEDDDDDDESEDETGGSDEAKVGAKAAADVAKFKDSRDLKTLFMKNLPADTTESDIKYLAKDCTEVTINKFSNKKITDRLYALVHFVDEATTDKCYKKIQNAKLKDKTILVDYVGSKSLFKPQNVGKAPKPEELDPFRLYVNGLSKKMTVDILKTYFPEATDVRIPLKAKTGCVVGFGFVTFKSPKKCKAAIERMHGKTVMDNKLNVYHAKKQSARKTMAEDGKNDSIQDKRVKYKMDDKVEVNEKNMSTDDDDDEDDNDDDDDDDDDDEDDEDDDDSDEDDDDSDD